MVHYCCVYSCSNNSTDQDISFYGLPKEKKLEKVSWETWDCISNSFEFCYTPFLDAFPLLVCRP